MVKEGFAVVPPDSLASLALTISWLPLYQFTAVGVPDVTLQLITNVSPSVGVYWYWSAVIASGTEKNMT